MNYPRSAIFVIVAILQAALLGATISCRDEDKDVSHRNSQESRGIPPEPKPAVEVPSVSAAKPPFSGVETNRLVPAVELNEGDLVSHRAYVVMHAGEWSGRSLREIIPPQKVKRIIRVHDDGFTTEHGSQAQKQYDSFISHLIKSNEKATDYGLLAQEREIASLIALTEDGGVYCIEILQALLGTEVSAINVSGAGKGVRIKVTGQPIHTHPRIRRQGGTGK